MMLSTHPCSPSVQSTKMARVASVQCNVVFGDPHANASSAVNVLRTLATQGVHLAVFPEAFLTGYAVDDEAQARCIAIEVRGAQPDSVDVAHSSILAVQAACRELGIHAVVGFAGTDGTNLYNGAILFEPDGRMRRYIKTHLPELGFDKFVVRGTTLPVFETAIGKISILICYDVRFPEAARAVALDGADIIALPTNWPDGAEVSPTYMAPARAAENRVFVVTCNRVGVENSFRFIGRSAIHDVTGVPLACAEDKDTILIADIDLTRARNKRSVVVPGKYETDTFAARRPELYSRILSP
jgi:predicted amidohydrolase